MKLEPEDIKDFQQLWESAFGTDLTEGDAREKAVELLEMMRLIYSPLPKTVPEQPSILDFNQKNDEI